MTNGEKLAAIDSLTIVLNEKTEHYIELIKNDEAVEVCKQLRLQIKEIQKLIDEIKGFDDNQFR